MRSTASCASCRIRVSCIRLACLMTSLLSSKLVAGIALLAPKVLGAVSLCYRAFARLAIIDIDIGSDIYSDIFIWTALDFSSCMRLGSSLLALRDTSTMLPRTAFLDALLGFARPGLAHALRDCGSWADIGLRRARRRRALKYRGLIVGMIAPD